MYVYGASQSNLEGFTCKTDCLIRPSRCKDTVTICIRTRFIIDGDLALTYTMQLTSAASDEQETLDPFGDHMQADSDFQIVLTERLVKSLRGRDRLAVDGHNDVSRT